MSTTGPRGRSGVRSISATGPALRLSLGETPPAGPLAALATLRRLGGRPPTTPVGFRDVVLRRLEPGRRVQRPARHDGRRGDGPARRAHAAPTAQPRVGQVVQALAHERDAEDGQHDRQAGEQRGPPHAARHVRDRAVEVVAPLGGRRRLDAEAEEPEPGEREQGLAGVQGEDQRQRPGGVAEHMAEHDPPGRGTDDLGRLDERLGLDPDGLGADDPEVLRDVDDADRDGGGDDAAPLAGLAAGDGDRDDDREQQGGHGVDRVTDHDEHPVEPPAEIARDQAERDAEEDRQDDRDNHRLERRLRTPDHAGQHVVAALRGAEQVLAVRMLQRPERPAARLELGPAVRREHPREHRDEHEHGGDHEADDEHGALHAHALAQLVHHREVAPGAAPAPQDRGTGGGGADRGRGHQ